eukprot:scaffold67653_cov114-Phaeocystis_antarctica.AAC.1
MQIRLDLLRSRWLRDGPWLLRQRSQRLGLLHRSDAAEQPSSERTSRSRLAGRRPAAQWALATLRGRDARAGSAGVRVGRRAGLGPVDAHS